MFSNLNYNYKIYGKKSNFRIILKFSVEVSEDFLSVLSDSFIHLSLYQVILGTEHKLIGRSKIPLRKLLERQQLSGQGMVTFIDSY